MLSGRSASPTRYGAPQNPHPSFPFGGSAFGRALDEAVEFCRKNGVEFYAVNRNYPEEVFDETISRKIDAEIYIDDKNIGGFPGWTNIWAMLFPEEAHVDAKAELRALRRRKKSFWNLFRK